MLKPKDLNIIMPPMEKARMIAKVNEALEVEERLDKQIDHWSRKDISDIYTKVMQDELQFIKKGRV